MEFDLLSDLTTYINERYTAAGGHDEQLITAAELLKGVKGLKEFVQYRGLKVLESTGDLAATNGNDAGLAIVKNNGIYVYAASGTPDGSSSFAAQTVGIYTLISRFPPLILQGSINSGSPAAVVIPAGYSIHKFLLIAALANTINIGLTVNGTEIEESLIIPANEPYPFIRPLWFVTETTIYLSGATSQVNYKILFD